METIYIVTREAVYRHEILGIYTGEHPAIIAAKESAKNEPDNHHNIAVSKCENNTCIEDVEIIHAFKKNDIET